MKAIVFDGTLALREVPEPLGSREEARVRVLQAGICNTDLEITRGYHQFKGVLGHEWVGVVEEAADPRWVGRRVVGEINCACHRCEMCRRGWPKHCLNRTVLGILNHPGAMAEFCTLPLENLHEVPTEITDDEAVFVEPLAAACEILEPGVIQPEDRVCLLGDGKLAQLIAQVLVREVKALTVIGKHRRKLDFMTRWGAKTLSSDVVEHDQSLPGAFDVVVEATGSPHGFSQAVSLVRPRGTIVLKSTYHDELRLDAAPIVVNEIRVLGSRCGPFRTALEKLRRREVEVAGLISESFPLAQGVQAFERAEQEGVLKVLVKMQGKE